MPERLTPEQIERLIGNLGDVACSVSVFGDQLGAADIRLAAAALAQMREERDAARHHARLAEDNQVRWMRLHEQAEQERDQECPLQCELEEQLPSINDVCGILKGQAE